LKNRNLGAGPFVDCICSGSAVNDEEKKTKLKKLKMTTKESKSEAIKDKER